MFSVSCYELPIVLMYDNEKWEPTFSSRVSNLLVKRLCIDSKMC